MRLGPASDHGNHGLKWTGDVGFRLRHEIDELLEGVLQFEWLLGHEQELVPEPVELCRLGVIEHQPP